MGPVLWYAMNVINFQKEIDQVNKLPLNQQALTTLKDLIEGWNFREMHSLELIRRSKEVGDLPAVFALHVDVEKVLFDLMQMQYYKPHVLVKHLQMKELAFDPTKQGIVAEVLERTDEMLADNLI